ncbi:MAG: hypothetical protein EON54_17725 [Alcaligenaceae bacterium]|nr:MAG: hypothetical protein EON54_17725 [Alcaligenaceae bacterium]
MELNETEIKERIGDGRIRAITLDTCIFEGNGNRLERGLLAKLSQFNDTNVRFVLSDVVAGEVMSHVIKEAQDSMSAVRTALKEVGRCWQTANDQRDAALQALFNTESPRDLAQRRFDAFTAATQLEMIDSGGRVDITKLLNDYFSVNPPFGISANKKNEFPDAIALHALNAWADEDNLLLLAVSKDGDWKKYCKHSEHIVIVDDLALALSYFHQNAEVACARLEQRLNDGTLALDSDLDSAVQYAVERINFIPEVNSGYFFQAELGDIEVTGIELQHDAYEGGAFRVVDKPEEDVLVVEAEIAVTINVTADLTFSITDSIDKDEVYIGSASPTTEQVLSFKVLLTFEGDLGADAEVVEAEINASKSSMYVDFGDVGPDWEPDEPEES